SAILGGCADSRNGEQGEPGDEGRQQASGGTRHPTLLPKACAVNVMVVRRLGPECAQPTPHPMFVNKFCRFLNLIESCAYHQRRISEVVMQQISRDLRFPTATCAGVVATGRTGARLS